VSLIAGCDYSTKAVDVVLLDEDTLEASWRRYELEGHDAFERARSVAGLSTEARECSSMWSDWVEECLAVGIEDPPYVKGNPATLRDLARVQGAILARLPRSLLVQPWAPSAWRKTVGLPGNASKKDVWYFVTDPSLERANYWDFNACDAYCIALATLNRLQRTEAA